MAGGPRLPRRLSPRPEAPVNPAFRPTGSGCITSKRQAGQPDDPAAKENIWKAGRTATGWSTPRLLHQAVNDLHVHWLVSVSESGDLYSGASEIRGNQRDIYRARVVDGEYGEVVKLGPEVNTDAHEDRPYIARDGSYLIFTWVMNTARTDADLLICFRGEGGGWREPVNMAPTVNSSGLDLSARVSDDGDYLLFVSNRSGSARVHWVSSRIVDQLRQSTEGR